MIKYKFIDLFAGCGGLEDGFLQSGMYIDVAAVEWLKPQVNTLIQRLKTKWQIADASDRVMHFDIQREEELFKGWKDEEFGRGKGLDYFINEADGIDVIIGGPPCQAYSVAGRVRDEKKNKELQISPQLSSAQMSLRIRNNSPLLQAARTRPLARIRFIAFV